MRRKESKRIGFVNSIARPLLTMAWLGTAYYYYYRHSLPSLSTCSFSLFLYCIIEWNFPPFHVKRDTAEFGKVTSLFFLLYKLQLKYSRPWTNFNLYQSHFLFCSPQLLPILVTDNYPPRFCKFLLLPLFNWGYLFA